MKKTRQGYGATPRPDLDCALAGMKQTQFEVPWIFLSSSKFLKMTHVGFFGWEMEKQFRNN